MNHNYIRLNPGLSQEIKLNRAEPEDIKLMEDEVTRYIESEKGAQDISDAIDQLTKRDNYYAKTLKSLESAAHLLEYCSFMNAEEHNEEERYKIALTIKLLHEKFKHVRVRDEDLTNHQTEIENDIRNIEGWYKSDVKYPTL